MADDSEKIQEIFEFHPCDTPRGMLYYKLEELTTKAQTNLNEFKLDVIRRNQKYLNEHTEVKAIVSILLKAILKARPKVDVRQFLAKYLVESWQEVQKEIERHIADRANKHALKKTVSVTSYLKGVYEESNEEFQFVSEESLLQVSLASPGDQYQDDVLVCRTILDEIIDTLDSESDASPDDENWRGNWLQQFEIDLPSMTPPSDSFSTADISDNNSEYLGGE